jgi:hypothetical protein
MHPAGIRVLLDTTSDGQSTRDSVPGLHSVPMQFVLSRKAHQTLAICMTMSQFYKTSELCVIFRTLCEGHFCHIQQ